MIGAGPYAWPEPSATTGSPVLLVGVTLLGGKKPLADGSAPHGHITFRVGKAC